MSPLVALVCVGLLSWGASASPSQPIPADLAEALKKVNQVVQDSGLTEPITPDQSFSSLFARGSIRNGKIGQLNTLAVRGDQQLINKTRVDNVQVTYFDVNVGLDNFYVSYDYEYTFMYVFRGQGSARISAGKDAARLVGTITKKQNPNSCQALLRSVELTEFSSFDAAIQPSTIFNNILSKVLMFLHNHLYTSDIPTFNSLFSDILQQKSFRNTLSDVLCNADI